MPKFIALDLHKKFTEACILLADGSVLVRLRFPTTRDALIAFAQQQHLSPTEDLLVVECTFNTWPVVETLTRFVKEVIVSNPLRTRAIAEAKIKTDKVDAFVLATLLRLDFLPRVWIPDPATQQARRITTERAVLVAERTRIKNRIHSVLHQRLLDPPAANGTDLFSSANRAWLVSLPLDSLGRLALDRHLRQLQFLEAELDLVNSSLAKASWDSPQIRLLMTLPGVDFAVAQTLLAALGDISRFSSADRAASYLGLVPSTRQSGQHCYHGPITKQGRSHARWMLVQAAQHLHTHPGPLGAFFRRIEKRKNRNVAVVATARKLVLIAWHMLRNDEPYRYGLPSTTQAKFDRLRIRATGRRKKGGIQKGDPRPAAYGTGSGGTRAVPSLDQIYNDNQLPSVTGDTKPGEQAMLEREQLTGFVAGIKKPRRAPRKSTAKSNTGSNNKSE